MNIYSDLSNRAAVSGGSNPQPGPHDAPDTQRAHLNSSPASLGRSNSRGFVPEPSIPLPAASILAPVASLKAINLAQAVLDGLCAVICFFFFAALVGSLPLAIALMVLGAVR
jgi:hypothetical protein